MKTLPLLALASLSVLAPAAAARAAPPRLAFPLACVVGRTCEIQHYVDRDPGPGLRDYRCGVQTYEGHSGIDFRIPDMAAQRRGVDVLAAAAGKVARLRDGVPDISIRAPGAPSVANQECGNGVVIDHGDGWETQYCHMARGSIRVKTGDAVAAGAPLGRVGLSGDTEFPHLHMTVRHAGVVIDPFAPASGARCGPQAGLWIPAAQSAMSYRQGAVLNAGFAAGPVTLDQAEAGGIAPPSREAPWIAPYVRSIGLQAGDIVEMDLQGPGGVALAHSRAEPLNRWKATWLSFIGKRRPPTGWPPGVYVADYKVWRAGKVAITRRFEMRL